MWIFSHTASIWTFRRKKDNSHTTDMQTYSWNRKKYITAVSNLLNTAVKTLKTAKLKPQLQKHFEEMLRAEFASTMARTTKSRRTSLRTHWKMRLIRWPEQQWGIRQLYTFNINMHIRCRKTTAVNQVSMMIWRFCRTDSIRVLECGQVLVPTFKFKSGTKDTCTNRDSNIV